VNADPEGRAVVAASFLANNKDFEVLPVEKQNRIRSFFQRLELFIYSQPLVEAVLGPAVQKVTIDTMNISEYESSTTKFIRRFFVIFRSLLILCVTSASDVRGMDLMPFAFSKLAAPLKLLLFPLFAAHVAAGISFTVLWYKVFADEVLGFFGRRSLRKEAAAKEASKPLNPTQDVNSSVSLVAPSTSVDAKSKWSPMELFRAFMKRNKFAVNSYAAATLFCYIFGMFIEAMM